MPRTQPERLTMTDQQTRHLVLQDSTGNTLGRTRLGVAEGIPQAIRRLLPNSPAGIATIDNARGGGRWYGHGHAGHYTVVVESNTTPRSPQ